MDRLRVHHMVVVEYHDDLAMYVGQIVDQDPHHRLDGRGLGRAQRREDPAADTSSTARSAPTR